MIEGSATDTLARSARSHSRVLFRRSVASHGVAIASLLFVYGAVRLYWWYDAISPRWSASAGAWRFLDSSTADGFVKALLWIGLSAIVVSVLRWSPPWKAAAFLGFTNGSTRGVIFGLLATAPLAVAVLATGSRFTGVDPILGTALLGPLAEEVLFRGFLFRQLHQHARWPVGWAIAVSAIAFGVAHVPHFDVTFINGILYFQYPYVFSSLAAAISQASMMTAGGAVFAWVCYRWHSIWPAIALHGLLNFWLTLSTSDSGGASLTHLGAVGIAQALSLALAVALTFRRRPATTSGQPAAR